MKYFGNNLWVSFESELEVTGLHFIKIADVQNCRILYGPIWKNLFLWWFNSQFKQAFPVWWCFNYVETSSVPRESLTLQVQSFTSMASIESIKIDVTSSTNQSDHSYSKSTVECSSLFCYLGMTNIDYNYFFYQ